MKFLITVHRPNDYDHASLLGDDAMRDINALNEEMEAAGIRVFVGGLRPPDSAKSIVRHDDGVTSVSEGRYLAAENYVDGFWVLECAVENEALEWGEKAAAACRASIEVRPFY